MESSLGETRANNRVTPYQKKETQEKIVRSLCICMYLLRMHVFTHEESSYYGYTGEIAASGEGGVFRPPLAPSLHVVHNRMAIII